MLDVSNFLKQIAEGKTPGGPPKGPVDAPPIEEHDNGPMEARLSALEARLDTVVPTLATKADISDVRGDIQRSVGETHKWMIATVIGLFIGFGGMFLAMSNALKPSPSLPQSAPIVIQVPSGNSQPAPIPAPATKP